jgi:hypothetical protein
VDIVTGIIEKVATNWQLNLVMAGLTALSWLISGFVFYYASKAAGRFLWVYKLINIILKTGEVLCQKQSTNLS